MKWDLFWGVGYFGWYIECLIMLMKVFEIDVLDIYIGGEDLIFFYYECEIV